MSTQHCDVCGPFGCDCSETGASQKSVKPIWKARDGRKIPIDEMTTDHLKNILRLLARQPNWRQDAVTPITIELDKRGAGFPNSSSSEWSSKSPLPKQPKQALPPLDWMIRIPDDTGFQEAMQLWAYTSASQSVIESALAGRDRRIRTRQKSLSIQAKKRISNLAISISQAVSHFPNCATCGSGGCIAHGSYQHGSAVASAASTYIRMPGGTILYDLPWEKDYPHNPAARGFLDRLAQLSTLDQNIGPIGPLEKTEPDNATQRFRILEMD